MNDAIAAEINRLPPEEKLRLVTELWDQLSANEGKLPIPEWHQQVLAEDDASYEATPPEGSSWEDVKKRIVE